MSQTDKRRGRNDPCACGSGKKYKQCCLDKDEVALRDARAKAAEEAAKVASENPSEPETAPETRAARDGGTIPGASPRRPSRQPWKKSTGNAHPTQRKSLPRKSGDG